MKINNNAIIAIWKGEPMGKLIDIIPGERLLILSLPGKASRTLVESIGKPPSDSTSLLEALQAELFNKRPRSLAYQAIQQASSKS